MKKITIPRYVQDILSRSCFAVDTVGFRDDDDPGYTILIFKRSEMTWADTLKGECDRLEAWARRTWPELDWENLPCLRVREIPARTRYRHQYARVDIYDPIMLRLEHLIARINH